MREGAVLCVADGSGSCEIGDWVGMPCEISSENSKVCDCACLARQISPLAVFVSGFSTETAAVRLLDGPPLTFSEKLRRSSSSVGVKPSGVMTGAVDAFLSIASDWPAPWKEGISSSEFRCLNLGPCSRPALTEESVD